MTSSNQNVEQSNYIIDIIWSLVCVMTLGFPAKYRERLRNFEDIFELTEQPWVREATYSDMGDPNDSTSSRKTLRQKQQEEWDRLNIAVSVITATSAATLAIQATGSTAEMYWLVTAFYSIAFGLSLQGLILITYMTITAGGSSDEAIARLAKGNLISKQYTMAKPTAFIMALPAILATYSSIFLFSGLITMVVYRSGEGVETNKQNYIMTTMIPVGIGFLCLCTAVTLGEIGSLIESRGRRNAKVKAQRGSQSGRSDPEATAQDPTMPTAGSSVSPPPDQNGVVQTGS